MNKRFQRGQKVIVRCANGIIAASVLLDRGDGWVTVWVEESGQATTVKASNVRITE
jgi:hypothetical protein